MKTRSLYTAKCLTGGLIVYAISFITHYTDISWCMISVMLVLGVGLGGVTIPFVDISYLERKRRLGYLELVVFIERIG